MPDNVFERIRQQRAAEAADQSAQAIKNDIERQAAEDYQSRMTAKKDALHASVVPQLTRELATYVGHGYYGDTEKSYGAVHRGQIHVGVGNASRQPGDPQFAKARYEVIVEGMEDGSVRIGDTVLSSEQAKDREIAEAALDRAYRNPTRVVTDSSFHAPEDNMEDV